MSNLYLLAETGSTTIAIDAERVESIVSSGEIVKIPMAPPHFAGLFALRSSVITVIDTLAAIEGGVADVQADQKIVVFKSDGHSYGLSVDAVQDVLEVGERHQRLGAAFAAGWQRVSVGVIDADNKAVVVVDPDMLVDENAQIAA
jgi:purine-binding chemotaxis protein CheW